MSLSRKRDPRLTLTLEEAAPAVGIGRTLAYELCRYNRPNNPIPFLRVGSRYVVPTARLAQSLGLTVDKLLERLGLLPGAGSPAGNGQAAAPEGMPAEAAAQG